MTVLPNSAPDSLTPKYWNLVVALEQSGFVDPVGAGAELVVDGEVIGVVVAEVPARH